MTLMIRIKKVNEKLQTFNITVSRRAIYVLYSSYDYGGTKRASKKQLLWSLGNTTREKCFVPRC